MNSGKKNRNYIIFIVIFVVVLLVAAFFIFNNSNSSDNESANNVARLAYDGYVFNEDGNVLGNSEKEFEINNRINDVITNSISEQTTEEELSSYSSSLTSSPEGRLTNIRITCGKLNETTVSAGDTFSFCDTVGKSTAEEGYQEASVFLDGKTVQALGGGNCQVSSTLYNAILAVEGLEVVERHEHGKDVSYVPEGKDAAVAYGSIDFRFRNDTDNTIKMYFNSDDENVSVRIVKLV